MKIYGISFDGVAAQAEFAKKQKLDYQLLSDPDASVGLKYDVVSRMGFPSRVTFILDPRGILRHIDRRVNVTTHGDDLLTKIKALQDSAAKDRK